MPDLITSEERQMIDDAIAAGEVTQIPRGRSAYSDREFGANEIHTRSAWGGGRRPDPKVADRRSRVAQLASLGWHPEQIAAHLNVSVNTVRQDAAKKFVKFGPGPAQSGETAPAPVASPKKPQRPRKRVLIPGKLRDQPDPASARPDKLSQKKAAAARRKVAKVADRRRFKTTPVPGLGASVLAPADLHGTMFPGKVETPDAASTILKDGRHNAKIGGDVLKGRLKGARIFTLTLEERETCPRSCVVYRSCYGNGMPRSTRWRVGPELFNGLRRQVADLCAEHAQVLIRLHVLGDFASFDYLALWVDLLDQHDNLTIFGFTAWGPGTKIGDGIERVRAALPGRFMMRHSGRSGEWGSFVVDFPTERTRLGDAIICPEQADAMAGKQGRHCGNCGLCWASSAPIVFVEH